MDTENSATDLGEALEQLEQMTFSRPQEFLINYLKANLDDIVDLWTEN